MNSYDDESCAHRCSLSQNKPPWEWFANPLCLGNHSKLDFRPKMPVRLGTLLLSHYITSYLSRGYFVPNQLTSALPVTILELCLFSGVQSRREQLSHPSYHSRNSFYYFRYSLWAQRYQAWVDGFSFSQCFKPQLFELFDRCWSCWFVSSLQENRAL